MRKKMWYPVSGKLPQVATEKMEFQYLPTSKWSTSGGKDAGEGKCYFLVGS